MSNKQTKQFPSLFPPLNINKDKLYWEKYFWEKGFQTVAGLDEAGRGALAGPVVAAAVVFNPGTIISEIDDSKKLSPKKREVLFDVICQKALAYYVAEVSPQIIDQINILQASLQAMLDCVVALKLCPHYLLIDGNQGLKTKIPQKLLVKGDSLSQSIGAASILAKVTRDRLMCAYEKQYPQFSFSLHKGYGTRLHHQELETYGPLPIHRFTFAPVKNL